LAYKQMQAWHDHKSHKMLPVAHLDFFENAVPRLKADPHILGVAIGGSFLLDAIDEYSDIDLVVYIDPDHYQAVLTERATIVQETGPLLESFSGEHVGESRLLICLFGPPLLHVDLKFVSVDDIAEKVEYPVILWERDDVISSQINLTPAEFPRPEKEWMEKRFWIWVHYAARKIGRGEIFETLDSIGFIRANIFGPIILEKSGARPQGLQKVELHASPGEIMKVKNTMAVYDARDCLRALQESVDFYRALRETRGNQALEKMITAYLDHIEAQLS